MNERDDYWQHDETIGEARFWREEYIVPLKVHKSAKTYRGRRDRRGEVESPTALGSLSTQVEVSPTPSYGIARFQAYAHLVNVDPDKNRYRFYTLTWQPSLFEGGAIVRRWGRIGTKGRMRPLLFGSREEAQKTVEEILKRRLGHGYCGVQWG